MAKKAPGKWDEVNAALKPEPVKDIKKQERINALKDAAMAEITAATTPLAPTLAERYVEARQTEDALATELKQASDAVEAIEQLLAESYQRSQEGADEQGWGEYGASDKSVRIASGATVRLEFSPKAMVKDPALHRAWAITEGLEDSLTLPWGTTNTLTKEALLEGRQLPDGVDVFLSTKFVLMK